MKKEMLESTKVASYEPEAEVDRIFVVVGDPYPFFIIVILIFVVILIKLLKIKFKK